MPYFSLRRTPWYQLLYYCFIRPGEARLLRWLDIDFDAKLITVPANISKNRTEGRVLIPDVFFPVLENYYKQKEARPNWYIFPARESVLFPVGINWMARRHRKALQELGFDTDIYKLYSWKHSGAIHLARAGARIIDISRQMRHATTEETAGYLRQHGVLHLDDLNDKFIEL